MSLTPPEEPLDLERIAQIVLENTEATQALRGEVHAFRRDALAKVREAKRGTRWTQVALGAVVLIGLAFGTFVVSQRAADHRRDRHDAYLQDLQDYRDCHRTNEARASIRQAIDLSNDRLVAVLVELGVDPGPITVIRRSNDNLNETLARTLGPVPCPPRPSAP